VCVTRCDKYSTMILISTSISITLRNKRGQGIPTSWARAQMPWPSAKLRERSWRPKLHSFKLEFQTEKKTSQNGDQVGVKNGWKMWTKFKVFIVELEMSRLWQHFAASVINSVSGLPSPLGKSWSSLEQARPQGGGEAEGPWLLQLSEASMCRVQGFLQRPLFFENILSDPSRWKETRANGIPRLLVVSSCISIHVIHQRNRTGA